MPQISQDSSAIFDSVMRSFRGRLDVKQTVGPDDAPLFQAGGQPFAMLHGEALVVRLHPVRVAELVERGKGSLWEHEGQTFEDWFAVGGLDAAEWTGHTMEALAWAKE